MPSGREFVDVNHQVLIPRTFPQDIVHFHGLLGVEIFFLDSTHAFRFGVEEFHFDFIGFSLNLVNFLYYTV